MKVSTSNFTSVPNLHLHLNPLLQSWIMALPSWKVAIRRKQDSLQNLMPAEWRISADSIPSTSVLPNVPSTSVLPNVMQLVLQHLHPSEISITEKSADDVLQAIAIGDLSSQEVLRAFCHRASLAHQLVSKCPSIRAFDILKLEERMCISSFI